MTTSTMMVPGVVNLDDYHAFCFYDPPKGTFIGDIEMVKWLVRHRDGDYWKWKSAQSSIKSKPVGYWDHYLPNDELITELERLNNEHPTRQRPTP